MTKAESIPESIKKYGDIIDMPHPESKKHHRMSDKNRAAQFAPFAALTGHTEALDETVRLTEEEILLSEDMLNILNEKMKLLIENIGGDTPAKITYFKPDKRKSGGEYITHTGIVTKFDEYEHMIVFDDKTIVPIKCIADIQLHREKCTSSDYIK